MNAKRQPAQRTARTGPEDDADRARQVTAMTNFLAMLAKGGATDPDDTSGPRPARPVASACAACGDPASGELPRATGRLAAGAPVCGDCYAELVG